MDEDNTERWIAKESGAVVGGKGQGRRELVQVRIARSRLDSPIDDETRLISRRFKLVKLSYHFCARL